MTTVRYFPDWVLELSMSGESFGRCVFNDAKGSGAKKLVESVKRRGEWFTQEAVFTEDGRQWTEEEFMANCEASGDFRTRADLVAECDRLRKVCFTAGINPDGRGWTEGSEPSGEP